MHARATQRNAKLQAELDQAKAEIRQLKAERFGKKSEKQSAVDRSNELVDPENPTAPKNKRGQQPGRPVSKRRDYSHLPVRQETVDLPKMPWSALAAASRLKTSAIVTTASRSKRPSTEKSFAENVIVTLATVDNSHER